MILTSERLFQKTEHCRLESKDACASVCTGWLPVNHGTWRGQVYHGMEQNHVSAFLGSTKSKDVCFQIFISLPFLFYHGTLHEMWTGTQKKTRCFTSTSPLPYESRRQNQQHFPRGLHMLCSKKHEGTNTALSLSLSLLKRIQTNSFYSKQLRTVRNETMAFQHSKPTREHWGSEKHHILEEQKHNINPKLRKKGTSSRWRCVF